MHPVNEKFQRVIKQSLMNHLSEPTEHQVISALHQARIHVKVNPEPMCESMDVLKINLEIFIEDSLHIVRSKPKG